MGRSGTSSCFKLITCGGDSADKDDLHLPPSPPLPEVKGSTNKRGWSFRKRSARHRVLSNIVVSENLPPASKEIPEPVEPNVQKTDSAAAEEKVSFVECIEEKPRLSVSSEPKVPVSVVVDEDEKEVDPQLEQYAIIVIQTAAREFLARKELQKLKNVVKLQAVVRGHIVRQHAAGTLRCVQAIVKMQALVRARHARLLNEKSSVVNESHGKPDKPSAKFLDKERTDSGYVSIDKLLSNKFARQLIESTPKDKPINIKCDSSKPNSAWNWLERWMSASSAEPTPKPESASEDRAKAEVVVPQVEASVLAAEICESAAVESDPKEIVLVSENEESLITYEVESLKSEAIPPSSSAGGISEGREPLLINNFASQEEREEPLTKNSVNQEELYEVNSEIMSGSVLPDPKPELEQPDQAKRSMKRAASDELETEGKKHVFGSKKASNPSSIDAQSKLEEVSVASSLNRSSSQDAGVEPNVETVSSGFETATETTEANIIETAAIRNLVHQYGGSECEIELSVTSTLDSPDRLDAGAVDVENDAMTAREEAYNDNNSADAYAEINNASNTIVEDSSTLVNKPEKDVDSEEKSRNLNVTTESQQEEEKSESNAPDVQGATEVETPVAYNSEASPRSHMTIPESEGTPSSQVSVKAKKNSSDRSRSNHKRKSLSAGKHSPSHLSNDSGVRCSVEQLHKEEQNGKRRTSFGSPKPDQKDEDPRDSYSSSGSLPHFMQATKSAIAKMNPNHSPRSSPDVQDREYMKKRHSLPGANGRHGSPHIQRSLSQAQPGAKANGVYVAHEKKWQR